MTQSTERTNVVAEKTKYPEITVDLSEVDGNAMSIIVAVGKALRRSGVDQAEIDEFRREATSGDYDNVLATAMAWVNVE
jgi:hypothetical protein